MCDKRDLVRNFETTTILVRDLTSAAGDLHSVELNPSDHEKNPINRDTITLRSQPDLMKAYNLNPRKTTRKGWAIFSDEDIPIGKVIIVEGPTLVFGASSERFGGLKSNKRKTSEVEADHLQSAFDKLSDKQQADIMSLHNSQRSYEDSALSGIFRTNVFGVSYSKKLVGIYIFCSRFNHSCDPNCDFNFSEIRNAGDAGNSQIIITTRRDIKAGEELTISYIPLKMRLGRRQDILLTNHGFLCDCSRCALEADKLYKWPCNEQQKVMLRFNPARLMQTEAEKGQGWDFTTVIESTSSEGGFIQGGEIIARESPLILLPKGKVRGNTGGKILYENFLNLSGSMRNKYLRLYNWRVGQNSPAWKSGPSYEMETTDEEQELTNWFAPWTRKRKPLPSNETLLGIWKANCFTLEHELEGVFAFISHLNHSCWPTCRVVWDREQGTLNLVTTRPLELSDEITIYYDYQEIHSLSFEQRQKFLIDNYGFECSCIRCSITPARSSLV